MRSSAGCSSIGRRRWDTADLLPYHLEQLTRGSGISLEIVEARGYRSIHREDSYTELKQLGFSQRQAKRAPGLLIPILGRDGQPVLYQFRPDIPDHDGKGRPIRYET